MSTFGAGGLSKKNKRDEFVVLHLSDVHFGQPDERRELPRITDAIVTATQHQEVIPDICIFSGDLGYSGDKAQFEAGGEWLASLISPWANCSLFLVPGNHDVVRDDAHLILRKAPADETSYRKHREELQSRFSHLQNFFEFHSHLKEKLGSRVLSDWVVPFGCRSTIQKNDRTIRIVGLNTALLSCDNDDEGKLVQDIQFLNEVFREEKKKGECVIAVGHHPLENLVDWNQVEVRKLLRQETGANLYLHGHRHKQSENMFATGGGESLGILEGGAAYQGSQWPQYFCFYTLQFRRRDILPATFLYSPSSGKWVKDNTRSEYFVAPLPPPFEDIDEGKFEPLPSSVETDSAVVGQDVSDDGAVDDGQQNEQIELQAFRVRRAAETVHNSLRVLMDSTMAQAGQLYAHKSRIKDHEGVIRKVKSRRQENVSYSVADVEDIIGFRYVTLFQSDLLLFIRALLEVGFGINRNSAFRRDQGVKVTIHTSRPENDPLTVVEGVKRIFKEWEGKSTVEVRSRSTGYSSIHLILRHVAERWPSDKEGLPIEIQLRSGLEEFWGQLDHQLRYELNRGVVGDTLWQKHLNVLKAQFDAAIQYLDVIKAVLQEGNTSRVPKLDGAPTIKSRSKGSFSTKDAQIARLEGLPEPFFSQVKEAFDLWESADASRQFGGDPNKFRLAADAFFDLSKIDLDARCTKDLVNRFGYIVRMERAFMLLCTFGKDEMELATKIYESVLLDFPKDEAALVRQGQVWANLGQLDMAIEYFDRALNGSCHKAWESERSIVHHAARMNRALCFFRKFERATDADEIRRDAIRDAIAQSLEVLESAEDEVSRREVLNNVVYFAWEEREFARDRGGNPSLSEAKFLRIAQDLAKDLENEAPSFREADTLVRVHICLGMEEVAERYANIVCFLLEKAAQSRSGGVRNLEGERFNTKWVLKVLDWLKDEDERDALLYSVNYLNRGLSSGHG